MFHVELPKDSQPSLRYLMELEAGNYNMLVGVSRKDLKKSDDEITHSLIYLFDDQLEKAGFHEVVFPYDPCLPVTMPDSFDEFRAICCETLRTDGLLAAGKYLGSLGLPNDNFFKNPETQL